MSAFFETRHLPPPWTVEDNGAGFISEGSGPTLHWGAIRKPEACSALGVPELI